MVDHPCHPVPRCLDTDARFVVIDERNKVERRASVLSEAGVEPVVMNGFIDMALKAIYGGGDLSALKGRRSGVAGGCCNKKAGEGCL